MNFKHLYLKNILEYIFENNPRYISVRNVRKYFEKKSKERSFINFIWRTLRALEEKDFLTIHENHCKPKVYSLSGEFKILIEVYKSSTAGREQLINEIFQKIDKKL